MFYFNKIIREREGVHIRVNDSNVVTMFSHVNTCINMYMGRIDFEGCTSFPELSNL